MRLGVAGCFVVAGALLAGCGAKTGPAAPVTSIPVLAAVAGPAGQERLLESEARARVAERMSRPDTRLAIRETARTQSPRPDHWQVEWQGLVWEVTSGGVAPLTEETRRGEERDRLLE